MILSPKRIQLLRRSLLWHKEVCRGGPCLYERVHCDLGIRSVVGAKADSRISRVGKIDMEQPAMNLRQGCPRNRGIDSQQHFVSSRRRRIAGAKVRRHQAIGIAHASKRMVKAMALAGPPASIDARSSAKTRTPLKVTEGIKSNRLTVKR